MNLIQDLQDRNLIQDIMPGTAEQLNKEMTSAYIGFDPTADSLHVGSLLPITLLMHLQRAGHKPIALVGGATGMVGDPSGKSAERNLLDEASLAKNVAGIKAQLEKFLNFDPSKANKALMTNNYDWFKDLNFLDFTRDVGKHISINYMMVMPAWQTQHYGLLNQLPSLRMMNRRVTFTSRFRLFWTSHLTASQTDLPNCQRVPAALTKWGRGARRLC